MESMEMESMNMESMEMEETEIDITESTTTQPGITEIPDTFPDNYTYKICEDVILVKEITDQATALEWLEAYKLKSRTYWSCFKTYKTTGSRVKFKKSWKCHFNVMQKKDKQSSDSSTLKRRRSSKNLNCRATITLTIMRDVDTLKKVETRKLKRVRDPDFVCHLRVNLEHNHFIDTPAIRRYNKPMQETMDRLLELFKKNHTPTTARLDLLLELYLKNDDDYLEKIDDGAFVPTLSTIHHLFNRLVAKNYGIRTFGKDSYELVEELVTGYSQETQDGIAVCGKVGNYQYAAICTPTMTRAHRILPQSAEIMLVERYSYVKKSKKYVVYMFISSGPPGGVPIGLLITDVENQDVFKVGLDVLVQIMPEESFFGKNFPNVILTSDVLDEWNCIQDTWKSSRLLLCQVFLLKSHWKWLSDKHHAIEQSEREEIYFGFNKLVRASSPEKLEEEFVEHLNAYRVKYPAYAENLKLVYERRKEWADVYRRDLTTRMNTKKNYVETIFRTLRDYVISKVKTYTFTQLVDFFLTKYEKHMEKRLIDFSSDLYSQAMVKKYLPREISSIDVSSVVPLKGQKSCFLVPSVSSEMYLVDVANELCACFVAQCGKLCEHLCTVILNFCVSDQMFKVPREMRAMSYEIATGRMAYKKSLLPLNANPKDYLETETITTYTVDPSNESLALYIENFDDSSFSGEENEIVVCPFSPSRGLTSTQEYELENLFERIRTGLRINPEVFVPATTQMLQNIKENISTEPELASALQAFGQNVDRSTTTTTITTTTTTTNTTATTDSPDIVLFEIQPATTEAEPEVNPEAKPQAKPEPKPEVKTKLIGPDGMIKIAPKPYPTRYKKIKIESVDFNVLL